MSIIIFRLVVQDEPQKITFQLFKLDTFFFRWNVYLNVDAYCLISSIPMMKMMVIIIITIMKLTFILKKKDQKHTQAFIFFNLYLKWQNVNTCSLSQISSRTNILFYRFNFTGWREEEKRGADVMTSEWQRAGTLHPIFARPPAAPSPRLPPWSPERHTLSGRQPKGQSSPHIFSASTTIPSILPVWWILFSALLSWVIWGIIPKVSTRFKPAGAASSGRFSFFLFFCVFFCFFVIRRSGIMELHDRSSSAPIAHVKFWRIMTVLWCFSCCAFCILFLIFFGKFRNACFLFTNKSVSVT